MRRVVWSLLLVLVGLVLVACGGDGEPQPETYTVTGSITDGSGGAPLAGVSVSFGDAADAVTTDGDGEWERSGLEGSVIVTPSLVGYSFEPESVSVSGAAGDVDFVGELQGCSSGDPSDRDDPCVITYLLQLQRLMTDGHYALGADIDASRTSGWNGRAGFEPIGSRTDPFTGSFDGREHAIDGLFIDRPDTNYVGLFGSVAGGGDVSNLILTNVEVTGKNYVGGLVGWNTDDASIVGSYSSGAVTGEAVVGGLVGWNGDGASIVGSYSTGAVTGGSGSNFGGLVGSNSGQIGSSYSSGTVTGEAQVGGLVGGNGDGASIVDSYSTGTVAGEAPVGGLVGSNSGQIGSSYSSGTVTGEAVVGGLVGQNVGDASILDSYSTGAVTGGSGSNFGGLVGWNSGQIESSYSTGTVAGNSSVGGLVGFNLGGWVEHSYWDMKTSEQATSAGGEGKTTAAMMQEATFVNWDFTAVWSIAEAVDYPDLRVNPR